MPITILFVLFSLVVAAAIFVVMYRMRGLKAAFIASGIVFVGLVGLFLLALRVMLSAM